MRCARWAALLPAAVLTIAACEGSPAPAQKATHTSHAAAATQSASAQAASANEHQFASWMASTVNDTSGVRSAVAGPVMGTYVKFEASIDAAYAAVGSPYSPASLKATGGGYKTCWPSSGGSSCDVFTAFRVNGTGRITGLEVNGRAIAPRLAVGAPAVGSQLAMTDVVAYRPATSREAVVCFHVKNISGQVFGNGNPAFLAVLNPPGGGQFQEDDTNSALPGNMQPGESAVACAGFGTRAVIGTFSLRTNDGYESVLTQTRLHHP